MKYSKVKFLTFFAIICSVGLAPINDASANDGTILTEVTSIEHDELIPQFTAQDNSLVQVDSDTYALAYTGVDDDGFISTFTISSDGATITEIATLEHDTNNSKDNSLVQVDSDTYALAYAGENDDGFISTFTISSSGAITAVRTQSLANNLEHDTLDGTYNSLVQVDSDTFALAYAANSGFISTFTISSDGATITEIATLEHDLLDNSDNSLVQVDSDTYALAYHSSDMMMMIDAGIISTFTISSDGATITEIATLEHDASDGWEHSLVQVDSDTYALAYAGNGMDGFISTFTISSDGATITEIATLEHDEFLGKENSLVQVNSDTFALAYSGGENFSGSGFISTFTISSDGATITEITSVEHDTNLGRYNSLVQVDSDTYALAYAGSGYDGFISTFTISSAEEEATTTTSSDCYDCTPPTLQSSHITILTNDYIVATSDSPLHITANVGDKVTVILNVTDNKSVQSIPFAALYTNYQDKPDSMNTYYANNYNNLKQVSTSFYEWNVRADDVAYDYDGTLSWSDNTPTVVTDVLTEENFKFKNDDNVLEYFMMPFTFTMNQPMDATSIVAKVYDSSGNRLHVTLPVTLEIIPKETVVLSDDEEIATLDKGDVIITPSEDTVPLLNEPVLLTVLSQWSGYSQTISNDADVLSVLGLEGESLPAWTVNLGEWVIEEKLNVDELITAIEYVNNTP